MTNLRPILDESVFAAHVRYETCRIALEAARSEHSTHGTKATRKAFDAALANVVAAEVNKNKAETELVETARKGARLRLGL